ncbi:hypothetical protein BDN71DRAFT_1455357 [Pleurotus eryngii]|uniref:Uncharacterized protein n=1 Tax=Pleurotus eryngii TaxID=5323 RepID=A0A9P5ZM80_PLEER|nr:hypothetical protein BDN71DRAFT_1455357 [Pleurotus eryngii]
MAGGVQWLLVSESTSASLSVSQQFVCVKESVMKKTSEKRISVVVWKNEALAQKRRFRTWFSRHKLMQVEKWGRGSLRSCRYDI